MSHQLMASGGNIGGHNRFYLSNFRAPDTVFDLAAGRSWGVKDKRRPQLICCIQGEVWVTQERDIHDYILDAGESFLITLPGLVLVRALKASRIGYIKSLNQARFHGRFGHTVFK